MSMGLSATAFAKLLTDFEEKHAVELSGCTIRNKLAWSIIKAPLYFGFLQNTIRNGSGEPPVINSRSLRFLKKVKKIIAIGWGILSIAYIKVSQQSSRKVLFYAYAGDKIVKDKEGFYFNFLVDGIIVDEICKNFFYAERSFSGDYKIPARVKANFKIDRLDPLFSYYRVRFKSDAEAIACAGYLFALLKDFFENSEWLKEKDILDILVVFLAELSTTTRFLKALKPIAVITSEKPGTGFMAACNEMGIVTVDLQHGIIDDKHPQYIYSSLLAFEKKKMNMPSYIGVFGQLHKDILLKSGFWNANDIVVLGNKRVDVNRSRFSNTTINQDGQFAILFPTQWTFYKETIYLLNQLKEKIRGKCVIILKLHPMEPAEYVLGYQKVCEDCSDIIQLSGKEVDIYKHIAESKIVIGFNSAVLLEAVSLFTPCISFSTQDNPVGIHSFLGNMNLQRAIKLIAYDDITAILEIIDNLIASSSFYEEWLQQTKQQSNYLYAESYNENCIKLIEKLTITNACNY